MIIITQTKKKLLVVILKSMKRSLNLIRAWYSKRTLDPKVKEMTLVIKMVMIKKTGLKTIEILFLLSKLSRDNKE